MPVEIGWYHDDPSTRIIYFRIDGEWNWDENDAAREQLYGLLDESDYPVYIVYDYSTAGQLPINSFARLRTVRRRTHPAAAHTSVVGLKHIYRMVLDAFMRIYGRRLNPSGVYFFATVEEAVEFAEQTHKKPQE